MLSSLLSILAFVALAITAFGVGRLLLQRLGLGDEEPLAAGAFAVGLGMVALGLILLGLGWVGLLNTPSILLLTALGCCWGVLQIGFAVLQSVKPREFDATAMPSWTPPKWLVAGVLAVGVAVATGAMLAALAPPTSGEPQLVRMELSKALLRDGGFAATHSFPSMVDLWCVGTLALDGGVCAQLVQWGCGVLLMLAAVLLATPIFGRGWAWVAGGLTLLAPGALQPTVAPPEAVALAVLATLAIVAWRRAAVCGEDRRWFLAAGAAAGGAIVVSPGALPVVFLIAAASGWTVWRHADQRRFVLRGAAMTAGVAAGVATTWYLPFLLLGRATPLGAAAEAMPCELLGLLGAVLLAAVPGMLWARRLRGLGPVLAVGLGCALLGWLCQDAGLAAVAIPPASLAATWVWMEMRRLPRQSRCMSAAAFAVMLVCLTAVPLVRLRAVLPVAVGLEDREQYLVDREPAYSAAAVANQMLRPDAHILSQEERTFYFDRRVTPEAAMLDGDGPAAAEPAELVQNLRKAGVTHLLLAENVADGKASSDSPLNRLGDKLQTLTDYRHRACDGTVRRYRLMTLR